jgi:kynurenine 3-monooxygenase
MEQNSQIPDIESPIKNDTNNTKEKKEIKLVEVPVTNENVALNFDVDCVFADTKTGKFKLKNNKTGEDTGHQTDLLFASDGAFSAVRYHGFQKLDRF